MTPDKFVEELDNNAKAEKVEQKEKASQDIVRQAKDEIIQAMATVGKANNTHRLKTTTKVDVQNDIAETSDVNRAIEAINNLALLTFSANQEKPSVNLVDGTDLGQRFNDISKTLTTLLTELRESSKNDKSNNLLSTKLDSLVAQLKSLRVAPDTSSTQTLQNIEKALKGLDFNPKINVPVPTVTVQEKEVDLSPLTSLLQDVKDTLGKLNNKKTDNRAVVDGLQAIQDSIASLSFPVPNYVLPFKDANGKATQATVDGSGNLSISTSGSGATTIASGQQALSTSAAQVIASRSTRKTVTLVNLSAIDIYIGPSGVTTTTGQLLLGTKGTAVSIDTTAAVFAIAASGTPSVSYLEEYS